MPHRKKPIKQRPKVDDESIGKPREFHGYQDGTPHHEPERSRIGRPRSESGEPGGGAGRRDEDVGGSGVYPASATEWPEGAEIRNTGGWGQKLGGLAGGSSELNPYDLGLTDRELDKVAEEEGDR
jgi:hypothetical protein